MPVVLNFSIQTKTIGNYPQLYDVNFVHIFYKSIYSFTIIFIMTYIQKHTQQTIINTFRYLSYYYHSYNKTIFIHSLVFIQSRIESWGWMVCASVRKNFDGDAIILSRNFNNSITQNRQLQGSFSSRMEYQYNEY